MVDAARLADELRAEQDHAQTQEKLRKALETQIKELQVGLPFCFPHPSKMAVIVFPPSAMFAVFKYHVHIRSTSYNLCRESNQRPHDQ